MLRMSAAQTPARHEPWLVAFTRGFALPFQALSVLFKHKGLKRYAMLPMVFSVIVYLLMIALFIWLLGAWGVRAGPWEFWGPIGGWMASVINWLLVGMKWIVLLPVFLLICYFTFTAVGMVIASPLNDMLSERVERALCRQPPDASLGWWRTSRSIPVSMWDSLLIVLRQVGWSLLVLPLLLVPVIGFLPLFIVTAYFAGVGFVDISPARHYLRNHHKRPMLKNHRWEIFGMGVAMEILFLIPFAGLLLLPLGVIAGTSMYCRADWRALLAGTPKPVPPNYHPPQMQAATPTV
ncbi:MAG: hypothetical protein CMJ49_04200 [Planctomycetaceae bacterium]|nr:hypothetical protein [Planctomycetaceae bacterium]